MPTESLQSLCKQNIVKMITKNYWGRSNPFKNYPSQIIHDLIEEVIETLSNNGSLNVVHLIDLLRSSRVKYLIVKDVELKLYVLDSLFSYIPEDCSRKLERIELVGCVCSHSGAHSSLRTYTLNKLILHSPNLKYLESCVYFDLNAIRDLCSLNTLILHFEIPDSLCSRINTEGLDLVPNYSLNHFEVSDNKTSEFGFIISKIALQYFRKLTYINCCLTKTFEFLHSEDVRDNEPLSTRYKLEHCVLGKEYKDRITYASNEAVYIASVTCPDLKSLTILADDPYDLKYLSNFHNMKEIEIKFLSREDFSIINNSLKKLSSDSITNVYNLDLSIIANSCLHLTSLTLNYCDGKNSQVFANRAFCKLSKLYLEAVDKVIVDDSLFVMLTKAFDLKYLRLTYIPSFNEQMFQSILKSNPLHSLTALLLNFTGATRDKMLEFRNDLNLTSFECYGKFI